jgi:LPS export ABC transporter protein LptC
VLPSNKLHIIPSIAIVMVAMLLFASCHRREVKLRMDAIDNRAAMPVLDAQGVTTLISDSGVTRFRITARKWQVYDKSTPSYWEFPEGIYLEQFDNMLNTSATLRADYAYYDDQEEIWHLTGNVHSTNVNGEQFDTPELFWAQKTERVYSDSCITIIQPPSPAAVQADGDKAKGTVIKGVGFESNQEMTKYTIRRPTGVFSVDE